MKTHRCKGSLRARKSIRYDNNPDSIWPDETESWHIRYTDKGEYDAVYMVNLVSGIKYCPYCGKNLGGDNE